MSQLRVSKEKVFVLLLGICIVPSIVALFHPGFFTTDDGNWMLIRFASFFTALRYGQFPVRFLLTLNHGYGYPVADFLYPLFMYLGVPLHLLKMSFINTIKILLGGSMLLSGVFCFFWLQKLFKTLPSFIGALVYVFFPYHLFDVYQRGSVGEVLALAIVPFVFWQTERKSIFWVSLGLASLILAHNSLALLFLPFIIIYLWMRVGSQGFVSLLAGLGLSSFFWLPALYDKQFTVFDMTKVSDYAQYFVTSKNFGLIGIFTVVIAIVSVSFAFKKARKHDIFFLAVLYIGLFFSFPVSSFFWHTLPLPQYVQFPFRFLSLAILGAAFMVAFMLESMKTSMKLVVALCCLFLMYVSAWVYLFPKTYQHYTDDYYATNQDTTTVKNEYMPKWVKQVPLSNPTAPVLVKKGSATLSNVTNNLSDKISFAVHVVKPSVVQINVIYFPGWNVFVNNRLHTFGYSNPQGVMEVSLSPGEYLVTARFGETRIRAISDGVSIICLLLLGIVCIPSPFRRRTSILVL